MTRAVSYRLDVIRNGACLTQLYWDASSGAPTIDCRKDSAIKRSMSGTFICNDAVNLFSDELRPMMIIDGIEEALGIYRPTTVLDTYTPYGKAWQVEAYDRSWILSAAKTEDLLHLAAGTKYIEAIEQMLVSCGIANAIIVASDSELISDREDWPIGTAYLDIINALLQEINYKEVWFDGQGYAHLEPYATPSAASILRQYSLRDMRRPSMGPELSGMTDLYSAPNVFVVTCSNPDNPAGLRAVAVNDSPVSSKSTLRRGMRITQVSSVNQTSSQEALQGYANRLRDESLLSDYTLDFDILAEPGHGVGDIIGIDHPELGGVYEEQGWSLSLAAGEMMHISASRTVVI